MVISLSLAARGKWIPGFPSAQGGFITLLITGIRIVICFRVKRHYKGVARALKRLDDTPVDLSLPPRPEKLQGDTLRQEKAHRGGDARLLGKLGIKAFSRLRKSSRTALGIPFSFPSRGSIQESPKASRSWRT